MTCTEFDLRRLVAETFVEDAEHHATLGSTNDRAREAAGENSRRLPLLIIADEQTAGRGRGSNRWWTGSNSLAFSLLLDPAKMGIERSRCGMISLAAAVAIADTVSPLVANRDDFDSRNDHPFGRDAQRSAGTNSSPSPLVGLHWPNDVFASGRKLAGILVEALADGRHIVGIGLNVNNSVAAAPAELQQVATSLFDLTQSQHSRDRVLRTLLAQLERTLMQLASAAHELGERFNSLCLQHGQILTLENGQESVTGRCEGVAPDGALLLATPCGRRRLYGGALRRGTA